MAQLQKPKHRHWLRMQCGMAYYSAKRQLYWLKKHEIFACTKQKTPLQYQYFTHKTLLRRKLKNVDMWLQENKIINLKLAVQKIHTVIIKPNEMFSFWKLVGKPTKQKGYVKGMVLLNGTFAADIGGGLCQLTNLIFWMTLHTPLTIIERHRHGYDVFPDANRTQPFGSGATCFYPHGDLMIANHTQDTFQLNIWVEDEYLRGEWRVNNAPIYTYKVVEKNHTMKAEYWGGYSRNNEIYQQQYAQDGTLLQETLAVQNAAIMMYAPFLNK